MSVIIQKASIVDLQTLYKIEQGCFTTEAFSKKQIASLLRAPNSVSLLANASGEVAGFVIGLVYECDGIKIGHVVTVDVVPKYRRKGIGVKLLEKAEKEFKCKGVEICYLEVRADNVAAQELYRKSGYVEVEWLEDYYCRGGHGIRLKKTLLSHGPEI